jgi:hypothetical protein
MFVNTAKLHSGADKSYAASEHAQAGADQLSGSPPVAGMFGDFADADDFHEALSNAHAQHVRSLQGHQERLNDVGTKAHSAASAFTAMDDHNASELRKLR